MSKRMANGCRWISIAALIASGGCAVFDPGGTTRKAYDQENQTGWGADGAFSVNTKGPQEAKFRMAEGSIVLDADGNIDFSQSVITHWMEADPSGKSVSQGLDSVANLAIAQTKMMTDLVTALVSAFSPMATGRIGPGGGPGVDPPADDNRMIEVLERLLERLPAVETERAP